jgi:hypothetical protein
MGLQGDVVSRCSSDPGGQSTNEDRRQIFAINDEPASKESTLFFVWNDSDLFGRHAGRVLRDPLTLRRQRTCASRINPQAGWKCRWTICVTYCPTRYRRRTARQTDDPVRQWGALVRRTQMRAKPSRTAVRYAACPARRDLSELRRYLATHRFREVRALVNHELVYSVQ